MIVTTRIALPVETVVEITIKATLADLEKLRAQLRVSYSDAGYLLLRSIDEVVARLRSSIEDPVETTS